jgi:hypothetical protein
LRTMPLKISWSIFLANDTHCNPFCVSSAKFGTCPVVSVNRTVIEDKCGDSRVNVHILASTGVPFSLTKVPNLPLTHTKLITVHTLLSDSCQVRAKFGTCTVASWGLNGTLVEAKMFTFNLECTPFIFNNCSIPTHDTANAKLTIS